MASVSETAASAISAFTAFPKETQTFLTSLRENNNRGWFDSHRSSYEAYYVAPARAFVVAAGQELRRFVPAIHAEPRILGSIFRITRDTRYGQDDHPYKDHLDFYFWEGERKIAVSSFFARVSPDYVGIGAGSHGFEPDELALFRTAVCNDAAGADLATIARDLAAHGYDLQGAYYKRDPKGFVASPEARPFLRFKGLFVHAREEPTLAIEPGQMLRESARHWGNFAPLHRWQTHWIQDRLPTTA